MELDDFYFNAEPEPHTYARCNPKHLDIEPKTIENENIVEEFESNNNVDILGKNIPIWAEIIIFVIVGVAGLVGLYYLIRHIKRKKLDDNIKNHSFKKTNNYSNNYYNKNKLF